MRDRDNIIIAIDGPAGVGKTTIAKELADILRYHHIDTGAMYRAFAYGVILKNKSTKSEDDCEEILKDIDIEYIPRFNTFEIYLNGVEVSKEIRTPDVTRGSSDVAIFPDIRRYMVNIQRKLGENYDIVMEGRDIGTYVFPSATHKFYLDADIEERVRRRMEQNEIEMSEENLLKEMKLLKARDKNDITREFAPLKPAGDAICIDTTHLTIEEVLEKILKVVK